MVGIQSQGEKIILDDIFLGRKAPNIGLGKLDCIDGGSLLGGHNGDKFRRRCFGRSGSGLPSFTPPLSVYQGASRCPNAAKPRFPLDQEELARVDADRG